MTTNVTLATRVTCLTSAQRRRVVRFLFRGFERETGNPVEGHIEAPDSEAAYEILGENGIITEPLREDPRPANASAKPNSIAEFTEALESALDLSSSQVAFDDLTERYRGKKVWVIDRDKIRRRVAEVVDSTLAASEANLESSATARERVADAISGLFHDTRNIASIRSDPNADCVMGMRVTEEGPGNEATGQAAATNPALTNPPAPDPAAPNPGISNGDLAKQIGRLTGVVEQAEGLIAAMSAALRNIESGGGSVIPRRRLVATLPTGPGERNEVLREIFQSNLELRAALANSARQPPVEAAEAN
jgi:hypothetical protein